MKKILLTMGLFSLVLAGKSQTVLNELYTDPGNGTLRGEFIELYNTGLGDQNVDCFTIVTYYDAGHGDRGWYVLDLPNMNVASHGFFVAAAFSPFTTQNTPLPGAIPDFSWNDPAFLSGSTGGSLTKWQVNGTGYTDVTASIPANFNNLLSGGQGEDYVVLVFVNGAFNNGFIGGSGSALLSGSTVTPMPGNLPVTMNTTFHACSNFNINFNTLGAMETVGSQPGSDNGYARTSDGKCGAWEKTSTTVKHTPGVTNGSATGITGALITSQGVNCNVPRVVNFTITGISGSVTLADDFPVFVQVWNDVNKNDTLDGGDTFIDQDTLTGFSNATPPAAGSHDTTALKGANKNADVIILYRTARGCFDKVVAIANLCSPLPVNFKSFTAARNHSMVGIKWETASEQNNKGFAIERLIGAGGWQQIAFVPTKAIDGNSESDLSYEYSDLNSTTAVSQYRLKQIDFDNKSKNSDIRAVRGEGQVGKTIVYPNPSNNGRVTIVFEDVTATRDVSLMDMSGRMIKQMKAVTNNNIQFENLTPGVYSLRVVNRETGDQVVEKIVVNNR